jgi:hypothetical protein
MKLMPVAFAVGPSGSTVDPQGSLRTLISPCDLFSSAYTSCTELRCSQTWITYRTQGCTKIRFQSTYRNFQTRNDLLGDLVAVVGSGCSPTGVWNTYTSVRVSKAGQWVLAELADCVSDPGSGRFPELRNCTMC